jgi:hypothetical protein
MPPFVMHIPGSPADHRSLMQLACITRGGQACWALLEGFSLLAFDPDMQATCITAEPEPEPGAKDVHQPADVGPSAAAGPPVTRERWSWLG